jgi:hypothetical protein
MLPAQIMKREISTVRRPCAVALILLLTVSPLATAAETPVAVVAPAGDSTTNAGFSSAVESLGMA